MAKRHTLRRHAAFTLAELLVAMAIIGIIAAVTVIAVRGIAGDARLATAKNAVTAGLDNARALALKNNAVVLAAFRVVEISEGEQVTELVLARWTGESQLPFGGGSNFVVDRFELIPDARPRALPVGVKVAGAWYDVNDDERWITQPELALTEPPGGGAEYGGRMLGMIFAPDGSIVTSNVGSFSDRVYIDLDLDGEQNIGATTGGSRFWIYDEAADEPNIEPVPFLAVYDDEEAREFKTLDWTNEANYVTELVGSQGYISNLANRIHFNRYTGVVLR